MARNPQAAAGADSWASGLSGAGNKLTQGVNRVTEAPTAAAARNIDGYLQGVQNAVSSGLMLRRLQAATLQDWKTAMINKAVPRLATAATQGKSKYAAFAQSFYPAMAAASAAADSIPKNDMAGKMARVQVVIQAAMDWKNNH